MDTIKYMEVYDTVQEAIYRVGFSTNCLGANRSLKTTGIHPGHISQRKETAKAMFWDTWEAGGHDVQSA